MKKDRKGQDQGQALVEYLFVIMFVSIIGTKFISKIGKFSSAQMGKMAHVLSLNLTVGVCEKDCFFSGYKNGYKGNP